MLFSNNQFLVFDQEQGYVTNGKIYVEVGAGMGKTSNDSKQRWNNLKYSQVKIATSPSIAKAFKEKCKVNGVSMASEWSRFMCCYCGENRKSKPLIPSLDTRQHRRKALKLVVKQLDAIMDAEAQYQSRIPMNLQNSSRYDAADQALSALENALDNLSDVFS